MKIESIAKQVYARVPEDRWVEAADILCWVSGVLKEHALDALTSEGLLEKSLYKDETDEQPVFKYRRRSTTMATDAEFHAQAVKAFENACTPAERAQNIHNKIVDAMLGKGNLFDAVCDLARMDAERMRNKYKALDNIPDTEWQEAQRMSDLEYGQQMQMPL